MMRAVVARIPFCAEQCRASRHSGTQDARSMLAARVAANAAVQRCRASGTGLIAFPLLG
jgi:hypothetical protein